MISPHTASAEMAPMSASAGTNGMAAPAGQRHPPNAPSEPLSSQALLQGQSTVAIAHNGNIYRLQATRLGKLILTK